MVRKINKDKVLRILELDYGPNVEYDPSTKEFYDNSIPQKPRITKKEDNNTWHINIPLSPRAISCIGMFYDPQKYAIEYDDLIKSTLRKERNRKVIHNKNMHYRKYECPKCFLHLQKHIQHEIIKYCPHCGQKLRW